MSGFQHDLDFIETQEWLEALKAVEIHTGKERVEFLLRRLSEAAKQMGAASSFALSAYKNTIDVAHQPAFPGDLAMEDRITSIIRWNALAMVVRANRAYGELGGHIASFASAAEIFELGFNHFFRGRCGDFLGDLVFFQPHSAPGIYARAFLEGRLGEKQLNNYRQESPEPGLCSYPHPWLMPDFWQFPTGSMGLGPMSAVYQAKFLRYLEHRGLASASDRHVWGVFGDGEMDEPESIAGLSIAARENLDNLTFIINCNLQRLDGPVRGNGQIVQELESLFQGAGWNVIKVLWGSEWDPLFARDRSQALLQRLAATVDGQYQTLGANDGQFNRQAFFEQDPEIANLIADLSDAEIDGLRRGGHDFCKLYAAFASAKQHKGRPTVILAKTKKGYGMGGAGESRMTAHQTKKLDEAAILSFRDRFNLPLSDEDALSLSFYRPQESSPEIQYLKKRRSELGGVLPKRYGVASQPVKALPELTHFAKFALETNHREMSTTMAAVRLMRGLLKHKDLGPKMVPIVADEARTFGMDSLFREIGIYSSKGQLYSPQDAGILSFYKETQQGQLLEEGISEAGAICSWIAAATAYSEHDLETLPIYIFYSMFGFQRIGDFIWAAADQRARGFLWGATAGRTTLSGEGLQHQDGASQILASTVPNCRAYDPAFAFEVAMILEYGMQRMLREQKDEFFYLTLTNESYAQPPMGEVQREDIIRGMYCLETISPEKKTALSVRLLGSGAILGEVRSAAHILAETFGVTAQVYSVTSFNELAREAIAVERSNRMMATTQKSHLTCLLKGKTPVIAVTDYVRAVPQQIAAYVDAPYVVLGTDGFGRSANRAALRSFFEVNAAHIALAALEALWHQEKIDKSQYLQAQKTLGIEPQTLAPWQQ